MLPLPPILSEVCLREGCKERCTLPTKKYNTLALHSFIRSLIFILAGMLIGSGLVSHIHAQPLHSVIKIMDPETIVLTTKVGMMETILTSLATKVDNIQSEADTTKAMGAGIGVTITFLQLLGFLVSRKEKL